MKKFNSKIKNQVQKINWPDHLVNLVVVILGISIAFLLESRREDNRAIKQEQIYLTGLIEDLEMDLAKLDSLTRFNTNFQTALVDLSMASVGRPYQENSSLINDIRLVQYVPPFNPQRTVFESLKSSGKFDIIQDFELQRKIFAVYEQAYKGVVMYDEAIKSHVREFIVPYCIEEVVYTSANSIKTEFVMSNAFRNRIFPYRYLAQGRNEYYLQVKDQVEALLTTLKAHVED
jgi:hypothetical protein